MKTIFIFVTAMLCSMHASAQPSYEATKPVVCNTLEHVTTTMKEKYGEEPIWFGEDVNQNGNYVMLSNLQTKTWTFVQFTKDWACVLGVGTGASPLKVGASV